MSPHFCGRVSRQVGDSREGGSVSRSPSHPSPLSKGLRDHQVAGVEVGRWADAQSYRLSAWLSRLFVRHLTNAVLLSSWCTSTPARESSGGLIRRARRSTAHPAADLGSLTHGRPNAKQFRFWKTETVSVLAEPEFSSRARFLVAEGQTRKRTRRSSNVDTSTIGRGSLGVPYQMMHSR